MENSTLDETISYSYQNDTKGALQNTQLPLQQSQDSTRNTSYSNTKSGSFGATESCDLSPAKSTDSHEESLSSKVNRELPELREKYHRLKKLYFEREAQVHSLQNLLAHQQLSQSRTSLDDSEYICRFSRLDGLISQLAFSIRKDWKCVPEFLQCSVTQDALTTGKQEMTAIGRAFICAWLMHEVFDKYFNPDLDADLSIQLKAIQTAVLDNVPAPQTKEEMCALQARVSNWRLTTIDGLSSVLSSVQSGRNREKLVISLQERLVKVISGYLKSESSTSCDLLHGISMIIQASVGIASHISLESRDIVIQYHWPGTVYSTDCMKQQAGIPQLERQFDEIKGKGSFCILHRSVKGERNIEDKRQGQNSEEMDYGTRKRGNIDFEHKCIKMNCSNMCAKGNNEVNYTQGESLPGKTSRTRKSSGRVSEVAEDWPLNRSTQSRSSRASHSSMVTPLLSGSILPLSSSSSPPISRPVSDVSKQSIIQTNSLDSQSSAPDSRSDTAATILSGSTLKAIHDRGSVVNNGNSSHSINSKSISLSLAGCSVTYGDSGSVETRRVLSTSGIGSGNSNTNIQRVKHNATDESVDRENTTMTGSSSSFPSFSQSSPGVGVGNNGGVCQSQEGMLHSKKTTHQLFVRMAMGFSVHVRGRSALVKAPVYTFA